MLCPTTKLIPKKTLNKFFKSGFFGAIFNILITENLTVGGGKAFLFFMRIERPNALPLQPYLLEVVLWGIIETKTAN